MFANKKGAQNPRAAQLADDSKIHILQFNKRRFVVGLKWETVRTTRNLMKEVRRIGRERKLDVVAIRKSDSTQAGFAPKTRQKLRGGYSLVVTLASLLEGCCIAVVSLGENERGEKLFTLVGKTLKGGIHPYSDEIYKEEELQQYVIDLKSDLRGNNTGMEIPVYSDTDFPFVTDEIHLKNLLIPKNLKKDYRLKPLTWGMTKNQLILLSVAAVMAIGAVAFIEHENEQREVQKRRAIAAEQLRIETINRDARYKAALAKLKHPWIDTPSVINFLHACQSMGAKIPLSIEGWTPSALECTGGEMNVTLMRPDNSAVTTQAVVDAVKKLLGADTKFFFNQTSIVNFSISEKVKANGDDPVTSSDEQLKKVISLFQSVNIEAAFNAVPVKETEKNEFGEDLPKQDWVEYTFEVNTAVPAQLVFINDDFPGVRIHKINYTLDQNNSSIQYKITGSLYAKN
ncbi:hypothetical protein BL250_12350 [Erwinia sp. OLTSP20]|uniref:type 4b pilus protein PilO2 n=1 Tax=Enterobacterales TaxID=91347 RepID=UPI000C1A0CF0|nr:MULTISPECIES: type 4b pilus protein PilO2 [Enterobacterales]PII85117.1 hypothetical protein BMF91_23865 [Serratia sp. OLFL2]PIJ49377.1 hypothetical protein BV501_13160 [Erwinia sp. OAMSP11]PIJ69734.1 hypothetical protein BK416_13765 [Erwinia sp. OLSSP12]PIJ76218.1 hypothetical protein BLD47_18020 [Erwinia sp. OLCASP19]PIJ76739.1 hypothetical protein BLD46_18245 [Erwinia sp. OLMTSP26]